jgi:hypothetical protein
VSLSAPERETVISTSDADDVLTVWSAQHRVIARLRKNPAALLIGEGRHDGTKWARFELPADRLLSLGATA